MSDKSQLTTKKTEVLEKYIRDIEFLLNKSTDTKKLWADFHLIIRNIKNNNFDEYKSSIINIFTQYLLILSSDNKNDTESTYVELKYVDILFSLFRERIRNVTRNVYIELMKILVHHEYFTNYSSILIVLIYYYGSINDIKDIYDKNELVSTNISRTFSTIMYENYFSDKINELIKEELKNEYNIVDISLLTNNEKIKIILPNNISFYQSDDESSKKIEIIFIDGVQKEIVSKPIIKVKEGKTSSKKIVKQPPTIIEINIMNECESDDETLDILLNSDLKFLKKI